VGLTHFENAIGFYSCAVSDTCLPWLIHANGVLNETSRLSLASVLFGPGA